jgi:hypothetical protein
MRCTHDKHLAYLISFNPGNSSVSQGLPTLGNKPKEVKLPEVIVLTKRTSFQAQIVQRVLLSTTPSQLPVLWVSSRMEADTF